jgi:hypothetical protein
MDDLRRKALEEELSEAVRERERLDHAIAYLADRLGKPIPTSGSADEQGMVHDPTAPVTTAPSEFFGMSSTAAARAVLEKAGRSRPLKTEEILDLIRLGGVEFKGKDPGGTLYRSLFRSPVFQRVGPGRWGLSAWYGTAAARRSPKGQTEPDLANGDEGPEPTAQDEGEPVTG